MQRRQFLRAAGAGAGAVGVASAPVTAQEENESADEGEGEDGGGGGGGTETVIAGPDGDFVFEPESLEVQPGTTVVWEWDSPQHNVAPQSQPDDADWEGHPEVVDDPNTYEHTFEVEGTYEYQCDPHASAGMEGEVVVDPNAGGGEGQAGPTVPASAMSIGIGIVAALSSTVALTHFFLKYGGRREE